MKKKRKTMGKLLAEAQLYFNRYIRMRDAGLPCISCGCNHFEHATHFFPVRGNACVRFDEDNVHGGCINCNKYLDGNQYEYGQRLPDRIGQERFDALMDRIYKGQADTSFKWQRHEVLEIIERYKEKCKEMLI